MTENEILNLNLIKRSISEKRLIEVFGTPKIEENYKATGRFTRTDNSRVLSKASRFCEIRDDGNRQ